MREDVVAINGAGAELCHGKKDITSAQGLATKGWHPAVFLLLVSVNGSPREMGIGQISTVQGTQALLHLLL